MTKTIPETQPDYDRTRIIERPDGFYWQDKETEELYGPFTSLLEAEEDMQLSDGLEFEEGETLEEAESEIGIADWTDADTGEPAEESTSHWSDD